MSKEANLLEADPTGISLLHELTLIESPSYDTAASERIARVIETHLEALGAQVRLIQTEAGTSLIADIPGTGAPVLFVGHTDTVWPVGTLDTTVPWSNSGDKITGPGVFDMKSGIVVMLLALTRVAGRPHQSVRIVLNCDEEVGSPTTTALLEEVSQGTSAILGFEPPHPDGALKLGRHGSTRLELTITGRAAHAALDPELGISAIDELVDQLARIRGITATQAVPPDVLCNVGTISGGGRANVIPDTAVAELGLRFINPLTEERVLGELQQLSPIRPGARIETKLLSNRPAWIASPSDTELFARVREVGATIGQDIEGRSARGAGDTNFLSTLGIPTLDGFGLSGAGAHAAHEHVIVETLSERADLIATILLQTSN